MIQRLIPVEGAFVALRSDTKRKNLGRVERRGHPSSGRVEVNWVRQQERRWHDVSDLTGGYLPKMEVLHIPNSSVANSFGWGVVRSTREIGDTFQVLVEFPDSDERRWLPWQRLRMIRGVKHRLSTGDLGSPDDSEQLRLRLLAWALRLWNENTGALSTFDIDPLPHQIHLVHHILASGNYNWLIADDVGLGKTIEVGLLLSALRQRGQARRVLLLTPAGLTRQWQEELAGKFGLDGFRIYGDDFQINEPRHWKLYDLVIGSMDRFKQETDFQSLMLSDPWDLVIVDEAHRLTRRQYGMKFDSSQRYDLVKGLRGRCESLVLLTATPHQGKEDSFVGLLELLHPDRREELLTLPMNPEIIGDMVFRNYKADVTDMDGAFIFKGKTVRRIEVPSDEGTRHFDDQLRNYLLKGYAAQAEASGASSRAIGFVMTVYRKLAASSIAAIHLALKRRYQRLLGAELEAMGILEDERYEGECEEATLDEQSRNPFFNGELELLEGLIQQAAKLMETDRKTTSFLDGLIRVVLSENPKEKVLVFTEYRSTQDWVMAKLESRFGRGSCVSINGGMSLKARRAAIEAFDEESGAQFLISTEAGGEGINLQNHCHVMVNYDLPWNPMRLVQRTGRLYRYGQKKRVIVLNMHQPDTADEQILAILYQRIEAVAQDMSKVQAHEYNERFKEDVLGELSDLVEVENILSEAATERVERTTERIDQAITRAKNAAAQQKELFHYASGFDPHELRSELSISVEHVQAFVRGMAKQLDIEIIEERLSGLVWEIRLPEHVQRSLGLTRTRWAITFDRALAARKRELVLMNIESWLLDYLLNQALAYEFGGVSASIKATKGGAALLGAVARWQNESGRRTRQELCVIDVRKGSSPVNPVWLGDWLLAPQAPLSGGKPSKDHALEIFSAAEKAVTDFLISRSSSRLLPDAPQWIVGGWAESQTE